MVTRTYKGDDVRLYVEESISEIDGLIAFRSEIDNCKINGTVSISKSKEILGLLANPPRKFHDDMLRLRRE